MRVSIAPKLNFLIVLLCTSFALSCCWSSYLIYLANVFWLTLRCPLLQESSLVQVLPQLFWEASQDFSGHQSAFALVFWFTGVLLPLSLFVLRYHPGHSRTCSVFLWCPEDDTSVSLRCVWDKKPQQEWLEIAVKILMLYFVLLNEIPAVGLPTRWSKESMWKCLHSMCVYYQSPSGFVWLFWCVQFLIWCLLVTFLIQGQSPKKDWHVLTEGGVGREMG